METQKTIALWGDQTFGKPRPSDIARRMESEVRELLAAFEVAGDGEVEGFPPETIRALREECADVYIMLAQVAEKLGIDLVQEATAKMKINRERRWARDPETGTVRHVSDFHCMGSGLTMQIDRWYVLGPTGYPYTSRSFESQEEALRWARSPEGDALGAAGAQVSRPGGGDWSAANVVFARDVYDYWKERT